ncbi:hypothetical protein FACS189479_05140 [Spirochaetia bacterium]|nr:hypothetical protein FACS189479_05140 [Spirochaetia bacterium]
MNQVYVIDFEDQIKIGRTKDIPGRLKSIETAAGRRAKRVFNIPAPGDYEILMHKELAAHRTVGEYFQYPYEAAVELLQKLIAENIAEKARLERERATLEKREAKLAKPPKPPRLIKGGLMAISEQIKVLMTKTGVKQKYVAEKVGLSPENFNNKLRGERFNREELEKLAAVFGAEWK